MVSPPAGKRAREPFEVPFAGALVSHSGGLLPKASPPNTIASEGMISADDFAGDTGFPPVAGGVNKRQDM